MPATLDIAPLDLGEVSAPSPEEVAEVLAGAPAPEPFTEEEVEAMYLDWEAREEARYCDGHRDQHYWAA
jgi:hypothetical protein